VGLLLEERHDVICPPRPINALSKYLNII